MLLQFKFQTIFIVLSSFIFWIIENELNIFLGGLYGGMVSLINGFLINRVSKKQQKIKIYDASVGFRIMIVSVVSRLVLVALLILIGFKIELEPTSLLVVFGVGQFALMFGKLRNKN